MEKSEFVLIYQPDQSAAEPARDRRPYFHPISIPYKQTTQPTIVLNSPCGGMKWNFFFLQGDLECVGWSERDG